MHGRDAHGGQHGPRNHLSAIFPMNMTTHSPAPCSSESPNALVTLERVHVTFIRHAASSPATTHALRGIDWALHRGEHWAIAGANGAGKSTLLRLIRGEQRPNQGTDEHGIPGGTVRWQVDGTRQTTPFTIRRHIATVTAEMQEHYVRQQWRLTGEELLLTGFFDSPLLYETPTQEQHAAAQDLARSLDVLHLLDMELPAMSQGQLRKLLVARAMIARPAIVVLDEVCEGLDPKSRTEVLETIDRAASLGSSILYASHRLDELPTCITHGLRLHAGTIEAQGPIRTVLEASGADAPQLSGPAESVLPPSAPALHAPEADGPLIEMEQADVFINRKQVLHGVTWRIMPGENWAVCGANGAGKSSLLRLVMGDERQAWGGTLRWFGDTAPNMALLHQRIGYVSDKFQATYGHDRYHSTLLDISGEELVWSGFHASVGLWEWQQVSEEQKETALAWMEYMGIAAHARQRIRDMSYGRLRRFMLCRAVAPAPELLVLDEPCSGLDPAARDHFLHTLRGLAASGMQLIYVTHYAEELIPEISHLLTLEQGRVTFCGPRENG